jgi:hypothetical protein
MRENRATAWGRLSLGHNYAMFQPAEAMTDFSSMPNVSGLLAG